MALREGTNRPGDLVNSLNELGFVDIASNDYVAAERHFLRAVMLSEQLVSSRTQPLQRSLQGYADLFQVTGRDEATQKVRARIIALASE